MLCGVASPKNYFRHLPNLYLFCASNFMFTYFQIIQSLSLLLLLGLGGSSVTGFGEMSTLLQDDNSLLQFLWVYLVFGKILNLLW